MTYDFSNASVVGDDQHLAAFLRLTEEHQRAHAVHGDGIDLADYPGKPLAEAHAEFHAAWAEKAPSLRLGGRRV